MVEDEAVEEVVLQLGVLVVAVVGAAVDGAAEQAALVFQLLPGELRLILEMSHNPFLSICSNIIKYIHESSTIQNALKSLLMADN